MSDWQQFYEKNEHLIGLAGFALALISFGALLVSSLRSWYLLSTEKNRAEKQAATSFLLRFLQWPKDKIVSYDRLYSNFLLPYYSEAINAANLVVLRDDYIRCALGDTLWESLKLHSKGKHEFALVARSRWLRSKNPTLSFELLPTDAEVWPEDDPDRTKPVMCEEFLDHFDPPDLYDLQQKVGQPLQDNRTFALKQIAHDGKPDGPVSLEFVLGSYRRFLNSHEALAVETYLSLLKSKPLRNKFKQPDGSGKIFMNDHWVQAARASLTVSPDLKCREALGGAVKSITGEIYDTHPAKLGINCFTVLPPDKNGHYKCIIHKRSTKVAEYPNFRHVIPAGTFSPIGDPHHTNLGFSIAFTVLREFLEEVFNLEEALLENVNHPFDIFGKKTKAGFLPGPLLWPGWTLKARAVPKAITGLWEIVETGLAIDLISLKPELTCVMRIRSEELVKAIEPHWTPSIEGPFAADRYWFSKTKISEELAHTLSVESILPAGMLAVVEGMRYIRDNP